MQTVASPPLVGHEAIRSRLGRSARAGTLHHAYLFEGPAGLGKRRVADWLVAYTNCEQPDSAPCGRCRTCQSIAAGTHPDVLVLGPDPKRATPIIRVDDVREVVRQAGYHRFGSRRRFILVDPADAMQDSAANALLKTLEEPPEGTGFILIVSSARALLPTIQSRCQVVRFGAVELPNLERWLVEAGHEPTLASLAAAASLGCPGRALDLADGGLERRREAREVVLGMLRSSLPEMFAQTESALAKKRARADWLPVVDGWFDVVEEMLRDATVRLAGARVPLLHGDAERVVTAWARRLQGPGIAHVHGALDDAREQLALQVNGRLVVDAFFARLREELQID